MTTLQFVDISHKPFRVMWWSIQIRKVQVTVQVPVTVQVTVQVSVQVPVTVQVSGQMAVSGQVSVQSLNLMSEPMGLSPCLGGMITVRLFVYCRSQLCRLHGPSSGLGGGRRRCGGTAYEMR